MPLRTDFDLVWRGYDRHQVRHYVRGVEAELRLAAVDRDAAVARAEDLTRQLEAARGEIAELRGRVDRISRTPIEPSALTERLGRMVELAHEEAADVTERARAAAEQCWATASQATDRLRQRADQLVAELDRRRREMETEHRELMARSRERVTTMAAEAARRRRELDERSARLREEVETDFELAMSARRAEARQAIAEQERAARERADRLVREAREYAERIVAEARHEVDVLRAHRGRLAEDLRAAHRLLADVEPLLHPLPEEASAPQGDPVAPDVPAARNGAEAAGVPLPPGGSASASDGSVARGDSLPPGGRAVPPRVEAVAPDRVLTGASVA
ncbi:hypothetical protein [Saccharothrix australiensis]|uniref:hypothetical protein n=1 Tax=Saccharothrix australiensis TaxID=2072 RepID=UPI0011C49516|nr:hypothetical protein [Saccharothrix australiensis]